MYKKFEEYSFRELVGKFVRIKNTELIKNPKDFSYIDDTVEEAKQVIIDDTKQYYAEKFGYDESSDYEDTFSMEKLNKEMTTRKVDDLYEPMYGYFCIEKNRGFVLYVLGNDEDKLKYIFCPTYFKCNDERVKDIEIELIADEEYSNADIFKEQIQYDEERNENVIKTRNLTNLDTYRVEHSPDYVTCFIMYEKANYTAKVKLVDFKNDTIYAEYHDQMGRLKLVNVENGSFLLFKPIGWHNNKKSLKSYMAEILNELIREFCLEDSDAIELVYEYSQMIDECYIAGDLPFETICKIGDDLKDEEED